MKVEFDQTFGNGDQTFPDPHGRVFQVFPDVHQDQRGSFVEEFRLYGGDDAPEGLPWTSTERWICQINTSVSSSSTLRGCHAQRGTSCQGKFVSSMQGNIFDVITDARPGSNSFGLTKVYLLSPVLRNRLWVPRGFLHAFVTGAGHGEKYIFSYFCDNVYDHESEITVSPNGIVFEAMREYCDRYGLNYWLEDNDGNPTVNMSKKDMDGIPFERFAEDVVAMYRDSGKLWYGDDTDVKNP